MLAESPIARRERGRRKARAAPRLPRTAVVRGCKACRDASAIAPRSYGPRPAEPVMRAAKMPLPV